MAAEHRPLFVVHTATEGCFVYDICLDNEDTTMEVHLCRSARGPVVPPLQYRPLAVSAGTILGVTPQPPHAATLLSSALHPPMFCLFAGREGELRDPSNTGPPIMLPLGDDGSTVIRMDTVIYTDSFRFEALRLLPGGGWHVTPLSRPRFTSLFSPYDRVSISSYFVKGNRVWISMAGEGIFSMDADEAGASWRLEFPEGMDFLEGQALHVPELGGAVVGLTPRDGFLCAYEFDERGVPRRRRVWREAIPWECYHDGNVPARDTAGGLAYLGKGRFCVSKPVDVVGDQGRVTLQSNSFLVLELRQGRVTLQSNSFLVLELRRRAGDRELELAKRGTLTYHGMWGKGRCLDRYFIQ